jgi:DNA-binding transcriptional ArsR family regulator
MSETHEHLEQAEHAEHHRSDPFNQRVAVSMAIVAACLAGISMDGHRTHNKVLQLLSDSNRLRTESTTAEVEMSNLRAWYQAKKVRQAQYEISADMIGLMGGPADESTRSKLSKDWKDKAEKYNKKDEKDSLPELDERAVEKQKKAEKMKAEAREIHDESEYVHSQADRLDIAHLLAEVSLVLCSITLLTKRKSFWYTGLLAAVIAIGLTASAHMLPREEHPHTTSHP